MVIGLLGIVYRLPEEAAVLNDLIDVTLQEPTAFRLCRAIACGMAGDSVYAKRVLIPYIDGNPDDEGARIAMAMAMVLAGDADGSKALQSLLAVSNDQALRHAGNNMLSFLSRQVTQPTVM